MTERPWRRFEQLPEQGKALRKAGCREKSLLEHCNGEGPYVRGCWVVDLIRERA